LSRSNSPNYKRDVAGQAKAPHDVRYGIDPEVLFRSGILRDPSIPEQASLRARSLIEVGRFREARSLIINHAHSAPESLKRTIVDQLAQCAMHGGGDWRTQLTKALEAHSRAGSLFDIAATHQRLGEMLLLSGDLAKADEHFLDADRLYATGIDAGRTARVGALRARLALRAGRTEHALDRVDETLQRLGDREPRARAFARLERARIQAARGREDDAARELMQAEVILGVSGNAAERLQTRIVRAEALVTLGDVTRAVKGLRRLLAEATSIEDVATRAAVHALFGQACLDDEPTQARRHLMRAHHLYAGIDAGYQMALCELFLARADFRLGLNPSSRLKSLAQRPMKSWPLLRVHLAIARGEIYGAVKADKARHAILEARAFATRHGTMSLVRALDRVLSTHHLVRMDDLDGLTPVDAQPMVDSGTGTSSSLTFASVQEPMPFTIDEPRVRHFEDVFATRLHGRKSAQRADIKDNQRADLPFTQIDGHVRLLDMSETLAHINAGDALQALESLAANDDALTLAVHAAQASTTKADPNLPAATLVALRASRTSTRHNPTNRNR
jgi:tetratricopeptide (TPR) repeat protein